ncbi:MAG: CPBP family intramembrane glutamic endopeptidase [Paracoccaceae bacterium]
MTQYPVAYAPHNTFIAPARARRELWRTVVGAVGIVALYFGVLLLLMTYLTNRYGFLIASALYQRMAHGDTPGGVMLLLFSFLGLAAGPMVAVRLLHGRPAGTLFGPAAGAAIRDFMRVALPIIGLSLLLLPLTLSDETVTPGLDLRSFFFYLPFALVGLLIQTGAEELVFRGYLQQQLAARFQSPLVWMGLPSALFAAAHYAPSEFGPSSVYIVLWALIFGCLAADLTARSGSLGAALGFHFANNVSALLLVGLSGNLDGVALWTVSVDLADVNSAIPLLLVDLAAMGTSWLLARLALRV